MSDASDNESAATDFIDKPGFHRGTSSGSTSSYARTTIPDNPVAPDSPAAAIISKTKDEMGLMAEHTNVVTKLLLVDRNIITDLLIPEDGPNHPRYKGVDNSCHQYMSIHGKDLVLNLDGAGSLEESIAEGKQNLSRLEDEGERLRRETSQNRKLQSLQKTSIRSDEALLEARKQSIQTASTKYAVAEWIKENPKPLAVAQVPNVQSLTRIHHPTQIAALTDTTKVRTLKVMHRLSWGESEYMSNFQGRMVVKPRDASQLENIMTAYLGLAPQATLQSLAAGILQLEAAERAATTSDPLLPPLLEIEEGDDDETIDLKRRSATMLHELTARKKQKRS